MRNNNYKKNKVMRFLAYLLVLVLLYTSFGNQSVVNAAQADIEVSTEAVNSAETNKEDESSEEKEEEKSEEEQKEGSSSDQTDFDSDKKEEEKNTVSSAENVDAQSESDETVEADSTKKAEDKAEDADVNSEKADDNASQECEQEAASKNSGQEGESQNSVQEGKSQESAKEDESQESVKEAASQKSDEAVSEGASKEASDTAVPADSEQASDSAQDGLIETKETVFAEMTVEQQVEALSKMSDEEIDAALATLSEEQLEALNNYFIDHSEPEELHTRTKTHAGPFKDPVKVKSRLRKKLMAAPRRASSGVTPPDGLEMDKKATVNNDGSYTITLETYTTGTVIQVTKTIPVDIVLVLDQSGSMQYGFDGDTASYANSRQKAMQDAVKNFIGSVADKYDSESADHRISIVTFGSGSSVKQGWTNVDSSGKSSLQGTIDDLGQRPSGATNVEAGMNSAQGLLTGGQYSYSGSNTERQKVAIVFTDGVPTTASDFSTSVASGAISTAKSMKNAGATVYTVGIFNGADPSQLYGNKWDYLIYRDITCTGEIGSCWGGSWAADLFGSNDFASIDVPAGNRFLNYLSSNFNSASEIGVSKGSYNPGNHLLAGGDGYKITKNFSRDSSDYYLSASNASGLNDIFQSISENIQTTSVDLSTETVVKDVVTPYFTAPENTSEIKTYTAAAKSDGTFADRTTESGVTASVSDGVVTVTGFDFNANCVTDKAKDDGTYGKKLIIEFTVTPDEEFLGGTTATNGEESGIVDKDGNTVGTFDVPEVEIPVKTIVPKVQDRNIYVTTEDQLTDMFNAADQKFTIGTGTKEYTFSQIFNGTNNASVDVSFEIWDGSTKVGTFTIPAGATSGSWDGGTIPELPKNEYTIKYVVTDAKDSSNSSTATATSKINVFKPVLAYDDKHVYYQGDLTVSSVKPSAVEWKCGDTKDTDVAMDTTKPELSYIYTVQDGTVDQTEDYTVGLSAVTVGTGESAVNLLEKNSDPVTFLRNCSTESLIAQSASKTEAFKIHVYTPSFSFQDVEAYYGDTVDYSAQSAQTPTWKNNQDVAAPASMDNTAPAVSLTLTPEEGKINDSKYVQVKDDFNVKAVVKLGETDVTQTLIEAEKITRTCATDDSHTSVSTDAAFAVHVKTLSMSVEKQIKGLFADKTAKFDFTVEVTPAEASGLSKVTKTGSLGNGDQLELDELPVGQYSVKEAAADADYTVTATVNGESAAVSADRKVTGTLSKEKNEIVVTNTLDSIPETGIGSMMLPASVMATVIAIAGLAFMAIHRRRHSC